MLRRRPNPSGYYLASLRQQVSEGDPRIILSTNDDFYLCTRPAATPDMESTKALLLMRERIVSTYSCQSCGATLVGHPKPPITIERRIHPLNRDRSHGIDMLPFSLGAVGLMTSASGGAWRKGHSVEGPQTTFCGPGPDTDQMTAAGQKPTTSRRFA